MKIQVRGMRHFLMTVGVRWAPKSCLWVSNVESSCEMDCSERCRPIWEVMLVCWVLSGSGQDRCAAVDSVTGGWLFSSKRRCSVMVSQDEIAEKDVWHKRRWAKQWTSTPAAVQVDIQSVCWDKRIRITGRRPSVTCVQRRDSRER